MRLGPAALGAAGLLLVLAAFFSVPQVSQVVERQIRVPETPARRAECLTLVIAGGTKVSSGGILKKTPPFRSCGSQNPYPVLRTYWREIAHRMRRQGVFIYLVTFSEKISQPRLDRRSYTLLLPGKNSLTPGTLNMTILAMNLIQKRKLPGHDHKIFYRTNLSTFTRFDRLLEAMSAHLTSKPFYGGFLYEYQNYPKVRPVGGFFFNFFIFVSYSSVWQQFIGGFAILLNRAAHDLILDNPQRLRWDKIDDVGLGHVFEELHVKPTHLGISCWLEHHKDVLWKTMSFPKCTEKMFQVCRLLLFF